MITFATPETLKQPKGGLIIQEVPGPKDHILGGPVGPAWEVLVVDGHWTKKPLPELQRNRHGDTFMCVSFSLNSDHEFIHLVRYNEEINKSDMFLGKGSGTIRGRGNSKSTVAEWNRLNGFVWEQEYPYTPETTLDQAYASLSGELLAKGKKNLDFYDFGYKWLPGNTQAQILEGLKYSPVQVDVENYAINGFGHIYNTGEGYIHEVIIFDYEYEKCWWVWDSENLQFLKFDWNYKFGSPMIHSLKKKKTHELVKELSSPAVYLLDVASGKYFGVADGGGVTGGDLLKTFSGSYKSAGIRLVPDGVVKSERIKGEIKAHLF